MIHSSRLTRRALLALSALGAVGGIAFWCSRAFWTRATAVQPVPPTLSRPQAPMHVYHLGHSLVGADMPHLLAQFAGAGHTYNLQLGSGTSLRSHWEPDETIVDFDLVNDTPLWRAPQEAIGSGAYDAVILTEMVELRDALKFFGARDYLHRWAELARSGNPKTRLYLYETWHRLDDPKGWLSRIDSDLNDLWLGALMARDIQAASGQPIYLIPGGQVLAAVTRAAEAGEIPGLTHREDLFAQSATGALDPIHLSAVGTYIIAATHFSVLYHHSPIGLPHQVTLADGTHLATLSEAGARALQEIIWQVVTDVAHTGVPANPMTDAPSKGAT
ncbi:MAG: hypothetical protein BM562_09435 [Alphaproteobacteria bacterium MedPE-SWcel]|nr:MAG: hypothetical protein BM562_09435 [Alphaproteobacteria bacterium MedPE-SWcel]